MMFYFLDDFLLPLLCLDRFYHKYSIREISLRNLGHSLYIWCVFYITVIDHFDVHNLFKSMTPKFKALLAPCIIIRFYYHCSICRDLFSEFKFIWIFKWEIPHWISLEQRPSLKWSLFLFKQWKPKHTCHYIHYISPEQMT